jgi:serine/threonine protein kinase
MQISMQVCDGLEAAHAANIVHRDLKPDNIFVLETKKPNFVKILDFGVAKLQGHDVNNSWQTAAGSVIGTPAYMSPEQASSIPVDNRSDIYSLGAILYELFTGHPVFRAKSFGEYVVKHMNDMPVPPRELPNAPKIPLALERVILKCLEKDPKDRYQSVEALRDDLARATATVETAVRTIAPPAPKWRRSNLLLVPIGIGVLALAVGAFLWASGMIGGDPPPNKGSAAATGSGAKTAKSKVTALPCPRARATPRRSCSSSAASPRALASTSCARTKAAC